ncbi:hypothetical protein CHUAL_004196 [Chamberlinius hualienensis]
MANVDCEEPGLSEILTEILSGHFQLLGDMIRQDVNVEFAPSNPPRNTTNSTTLRVNDVGGNVLIPSPSIVSNTIATKPSRKSKTVGRRLIAKPLQSDDDDNINVIVKASRKPNKGPIRCPADFTDTDSCKKNKKKHKRKKMKLNDDEKVDNYLPPTPTVPYDSKSLYWPPTVSYDGTAPYQPPTVAYDGTFPYRPPTPSVGHGDTYPENFHEYISALTNDDESCTNSTRTPSRIRTPSPSRIRTPSPSPQRFMSGCSLTFISK